jgi:hypothetical protein
MKCRRETKKARRAKKTKPHTLFVLFALLAFFVSIAPSTAKADFKADSSYAFSLLHQLPI